MGFIFHMKHGWYLLLYLNLLFITFQYMQIAFSLDFCFLGQFRMFPQKLCSPKPPARFPCIITFSASCCDSCSCQGQEFPCSGFSFHAVQRLLSPSAELWVCSLSQWEPKLKVKLHRACNQLVEPRYCVLLPESMQCILFLPSLVHYPSPFLKAF